MPFDATPTDDGGDDPAAGLRAWASIRISCAEAMIADGAEQHLQQARFLVAQIVYAICEFRAIWNYVPDLGVLDDRLDVLRSMLA
jgi:hypothetical protein